MNIQIPATNRMRSSALALCALTLGTATMWSQTPQAVPPPPPPPQSDGAPPPPPRPRMEQMQERRVEMMAKHLNMTPDQVAQLKTIDKDGWAQMTALRQDATMPPPEKHEKMKAIHEAQTAKIRAILTDEQKPKFDQMIAREQEHMDHRRGPGGDGNQPPPPPAA